MYLYAFFFLFKIMINTQNNLLKRTRQIFREENKKREREREREKEKEKRE